MAKRYLAGRKGVATIDRLSCYYRFILAYYQRFLWAGAAWFLWAGAACLRKWPEDDCPIGCHYRVMCDGLNDVLLFYVLEHRLLEGLSVARHTSQLYFHLARNQLLEKCWDWLAFFTPPCCDHAITSAGVIGPQLDRPLWLHIVG